MIPVLRVTPTKLAVTMPLVGPIFPAARLLLLQVPPPGASVNAVVVPAHMEVAPIIGPGNGLTVNVASVVQPVGKVYVMIAMPPAGLAVLTNPPPAPGPAVTGTIAGVLLLHVPKGVASLNCEVWP